MFVGCRRSYFQRPVHAGRFANRTTAGEMLLGTIGPNRVPWEYLTREQRGRPGPAGGEVADEVD